MILYIGCFVGGLIVGALFGVRNPKTMTALKLISKEKLNKVVQKFNRGVLIMKGGMGCIDETWISDPTEA